jgi:photosystem II stability/assembly factor-like uncharacterized protein
MAPRSLVVLVALLPALSVGANADEPFSQRDDEARSIIERIKLYRERHGVLGELDSQQMLERTRWSYHRWLDEEQRRRSHTETGNGWVSLGPSNGAGRTTAVAPHPSIAGTLLVGAASGGVWKTTDHGATWRPLTDGLSDLSVGALVYAPSNPEVVYLGSGEAGLGSFFVPGIGLLRSSDGGETWFLPQPSEVVAEQFFAISVDPRDEDRLLAATENGLYATVDGGLTWDYRLGHPELFGITEVIRSSSDPDRMWAAPWCFSQCPEGLGRVMRSADGGVTWQRADQGLPDGVFNNPVLNRVALTVAASDPRVLYVALNTSDYTPQGPAVAIFRSPDGGDTWNQTADPGPYLLAQGWYDNAITVHPDDPDLVVAAGVWYVRSTDGGASWTTLDPIAAGDWMGTDTLPHVDGHAFAWQNDDLWLGCDGGVWYSVDAGATWTERNETLVTRQYYGVDIDPIRTDRVLGGTQDNKTNLRLGPGTADWEWVLDGDGFDCAINPLIPDLVYGTIYGTLIFRSYDGGFVWENISPGTGGDANPFKTPLTMRSERPWQLFTGSSRVWQSDDAGSTWTALETEVAGGEWSSLVVRSVAVTPLDPQRIMIGKGTEVYTSSDAGATWRATKMASNVNSVAISPFDTDLAVACLARTPDGEPQVRRTTDGGLSWHGADTGLPPFAVQVARWDPNDEATLYAGTDVGLYRSTDSGVSWSLLGDGLPAVSVHDLRVAEDGTRVVMASHGRGMWQLELAEPVGQPPSVTMAGPDTAVIGEPVTYTATATDPDGDVLTIRWLHSDDWQLLDGPSGTGSVASTLEHGFASGGRFLVAANAVDATARTGFDSLVVTAFEPGESCETPRIVPAAGPFPHTILTENVDATIGPEDPQPACAVTPGDPDAGRWASIWLEFTPAESGTYTFSTCGSRSDGVLSAWTGPACGPYEPIAGGCSTSDYLRHCAGQDTDAWLELELDGGETTRVMVGANEAGKLGRLRITVDCPSCRPAPDGRTLLVPAAASQPGAGGTSWTSSLELVNPGDVPSTTEIRLLPGPGSFPAAATLEVAAGGAVVLDDAVGWLTGGTGAGGLWLESSIPIAATTRTATTSAGGSFGQGIPTISPEQTAADGGRIRLAGLVSDSRYRTNLGLVNPGDPEIRLVVSLYDSQAELIAELERTVGPGRWLQLNRVFESAGVGEVVGGLAVIRQPAVGGRFFAYASIVDERTGDPTYVPPTDIARVDEPLWIPAVAHTDGVGGVAWRTDLAIFNTSTGDSVARIELIRSGTVTADKAIHIPEGWTMTLDDVVADALASDGAGALRITPTRNLLMATSRTYSVSGDGSYGQGIPGIAEGAAVGPGQAALLAGLRQDGRFRTNLGFVNIGDTPIEVSVTAHATDGAVIATLVYPIGALSWLQANQPLPRSTAFAIATSSGTVGRFLTYASVVDRRTDDPTYIQAVPLR